MFMPNRKTKRPGFSLIELMVTILIASIVLLGLANIMADAHRGYGKMYERIHGDVVNDAYVARLRFDKICRRARAGTAVVDTSVPSLQVLYYATPNMDGDADLPPDRYAEFYLSGTDLMLDTGITPGTPTAPPETVASNVIELQFSAPLDGKSVQMVMTLSDSDHSMTVTCGSIMHN